MNQSTLYFVFAGLMFASGSATTPCNDHSCSSVESDSSSLLQQSKASLKEAVVHSSNRKGKQDMLKLQSSMQTAAVGVVLKGDAAPSADVLQDIQVEMANVEKSLLNEHTADQTDLDDFVAAVTCNTDYLDDAEVASAKKAVAAARLAHSACRAKEEEAFTNMTLLCKEDTDAKTTALAALPVAPKEITGLLAYMGAMTLWLSQHKSIVARTDALCKSSTSTYESIAKSCDDKQIIFEDDVCVYRQAVNSACKSLVTCYTRATSGFETLSKQVEVKEAERKLMLISVKKVTCFVEVIKASTPTQAALDSCLNLDSKTNTVYLSSTTDALIITVPSLPVNVECDCADVMEVPGDSAWFTKELGGFVADRLQPVTPCSVPLYSPPSKYGCTA